MLTEHAVRDSPRDWQRNLFAVTAATFIGYTGFTLFVPVLPPFIEQLGASGVRETALWSGLSLGITSVVSALLSPAWGRLADRIGRKIVLVRAFGGCAAVMAMVPLATHPWHVFVLRGLQGLFTGYGGLAVAMAAESAPPGKLSSSIGLVQTAQRLGPAIGPVIGGLISAAVGVRWAFLVSAALYGMALVIVATLYGEKQPAAGDPGDAAPVLRLRTALSFPNFLLMFATIGLVQYVDRSLGPIFPLYVVTLGIAPVLAPTVAGILFSVVACSAAVGHHLSGHALRRLAPRTVIGWGCAAAAAAAVVMSFVQGVVSFGVATGLFGVAIGMTMTSAYTAAGLVVPAGAHGTAFGLLASASLGGIALGPSVSGVIGGFDLRWVFLADALILAGVLVSVVRLMPSRGHLRP